METCEEIEILETENNKLKEKIKELESQVMNHLDKNGYPLKTG